MQFRIDDSSNAEINLLAAEQAIASMQSAMRSADHGSGLTSDFFREVADWLREQGLENAGLAVAWQFWMWLGQYRQACAAATKPHAQIAYWYKIDPFAITEEQQIGLLANLYSVQCQERVYRRDYEPSDYEAVYQLFKRAYDDEELAQRQKSAAFALFVDRRTRAS